MMRLRLLLCLVTGVLCCSPAQAQYALTLGDASGSVGDPVAVAVMLDSSSGNLAGWSYGVCHEETLLTLNTVNDGADTAFFAPDFNSVELFADGFSVGVVFFGAGLTFLPAGSDHELAVAHYTILSAVSDDTTDLCFCTNLGVPTVDVVVVEHSSGTTIVPTTACGSVEMNSSEEFRRGDGNDDGVVNIADAVYLLAYLFAAAPPPPCQSAADANDDGVLNLADAVAQLGTLFAANPPLPAPGVQFCGIDPTPDTLPCDLVSSCP